MQKIVVPLGFGLFCSLYTPTGWVMSWLEIR